MKEPAITGIPDFKDCRSISNRVFRHYAMGDRRLNKRAVSIGARLLMHPGVPFQQAFPGWDQAKGFYRFVENKRVSMNAISEPIYLDAAARCGAYPKIYVPMDTTTIVLPITPIREAFGPTGKKTESKGFFLHSAMALTAAGLPIGLLDQQVWMRDAATLGKKHTRKERPIEEKESQKWLNAVRETMRRMEQVLGSRSPEVVFIGDRESDIHELYELFHALKAQKVGGIIRGSWNRRITEEPRHLRDYVESQPAVTHLTITVPRAPGRSQREAVLSIRYASEVTLSPNREKYPKRHPIGVAVVSAIEEHPPADEKDPINWLIVTTEPVTQGEAAVRIIELYKSRWRIEDFHFILKSGCAIEKYQFDDPERYFKVALLMSFVAMELLRLTYLGRIHPEDPADTILSEIQLKVLRIKLRIRAGPNRMTIGEAIASIGKLGGHLGRKHDGPPGVKTLWRGWRDLQTLVEYTIAMNDMQN